MRSPPAVPSPTTRAWPAAPQASLIRAPAAGQRASSIAVSCNDARMRSKASSGFMAPCSLVQRPGPRAEREPDPQRRSSVRLDIVAAFRNGHLPPGAARSGPGLEKSRMRFDDPVRVHCQASAEPEQFTIRRDDQWTGKSVWLLRPDTRPAAATAPAKRPGHKVGMVRSRSWLSPNKESGASDTLMRTRTATPSRGETLPRRLGDSSR